MPMFPQEDTLQTGDLLFPRTPGTHRQARSSFTRWLELAELRDSRLTMRDYLGAPRAKVLSAQNTEVSALLTSASASATLRTTYFQPGPLDSRAAEAKRDMQSMLFAILKSCFPQLLKEWLDMTVYEFIRHPFVMILTSALDRDVNAGFFVGHVALALRMTDGAHDPAGMPWVIEANASDYSHYRVSLHPYWVNGEPETTVARNEQELGRVRGWANRRLALGQGIWHSRAVPLDGNGSADAHAWRNSIAARATTYLGRPYGFFDDPEFGQTSRLYCGEFVHRVFQDVAPWTAADKPSLRIDQNRTWMWLYDHRRELGDADFVQTIEKGLAKDGLLEKMKDKAFFILTLHMLYRSANLRHLLQPDNEPYA